MGFKIPADLKVYGAFVGTESSVTTRAGSAANTILEGDYTTGNVEHVVTITGASGSCVGRA
jgi:hypothetical protein